MHGVFPGCIAGICVVFVDFPPTVGNKIQSHNHAQHQRAYRSQHPRFFRAHNAFDDNFLRQQICIDFGFFQTLNAQTIARRIGQQVVGKCRLLDHFIAFEFLELGRFGDVDFQLSIQKLAQTGQLCRIPQQHNLGYFRGFFHTLEKRQRSLDLIHQIVKHRPHRFEDRFGVFRLAGIALKMFRFGLSQLQFSGQLPGKVVAADRNIAQPELHPIGHNQIRGIRSNGHDDNRCRRIFGIVIFGIGQLVQHVMTDHIEDG